MRTGILTFHDTTNFGSLLQTYALYKVLCNNKIDCDVLNYQCAEIREREFKYESIRSFTIKNIVKYFMFSSKSKKKHRELLRFLENNVSLSRLYNRENIIEANADYDCFIVGSDIVWGMDVTGNDTSYFLDFVLGNKLKMSYASSANEIEKTEYANRITDYLSRFDLISVREKKIKSELSRCLISKKIELVCDPTMLLDTQCWKRLACSSDYNNRLSKEDYILMYFPDGEGKMLCDAKILKKKYNCETYCINDTLPLRGVKNIHISKIEDFLCFILHAKLILSGSYHGTLFSMYFQREFYYYVRAHGERMKTLAEILEIEDRQASQLMVDDSINYLKVDKKIKDYRIKSYKYVEKMIERIREYE